MVSLTSLHTYSFSPAGSSVKKRGLLPRVLSQPMAVSVPSGKFVYVSNRGHDTIATFAVDDVDGTLSAIGWESTQGNKPRFFTLDPAGVKLYVCNEDSDTIVAFQLDPSTGLPVPTGVVIKTGSPSCIAFVK